MEAAFCTEIVLPACQTTWCYVQEDLTVASHCQVILQSRISV